MPEALQVYQQLLPYVAEVERFEVNQRIQDLQRDIHMDQATRYRGLGVDAPRLSHAIFCPVCGSSNPKNGVRCWECGQMLVSNSNPLDQLHEHWQNPQFRRVVTDTTLGVILTVGLIRVCYDAPIELKVIAIFLAFVTISWQVWLRVTGR